MADWFSIRSAGTKRTTAVSPAKRLQTPTGFGSRPAERVEHVGKAFGVHPLGCLGAPAHTLAGGHQTLCPRKHFSRSNKKAHQHGAPNLHTVSVPYALKNKLAIGEFNLG